MALASGRTLKLGLGMQVLDASSSIESNVQAQLKEKIRVHTKAHILEHRVKTYLIIKTALNIRKLSVQGHFRIIYQVEERLDIMYSPLHKDQSTLWLSVYITLWFSPIFGAQVSNPRYIRGLNSDCL